MDARKRPRAGKGRSGVWRDALRDSDLDRTAKLVGLVLSTYLNRHSLAWPSRQTIAKGASLSDRAVDKALRRLEEAGFLSVERSKGGNNRPNAYAALLPSTVNAVRRSEWLNSEPDTFKGEAEALNGERPSHESNESIESNGGRLSGVAVEDLKEDTAAAEAHIRALVEELGKQ